MFALPCGNCARARVHDYCRVDAGVGHLRQQHRFQLDRRHHAASDSRSAGDERAGQRDARPVEHFARLRRSRIPTTAICASRIRASAGILAYHHDWLTLTGGATPERIYVANVSSNFFDVLGVKPVLGRFFLPEEETRPDAVPYVVLSYSIWKTRYASDPAIVGKSIEIARHPVTVIGVAPEGFIGAMPGIRQEHG